MGNKANPWEQNPGHFTSVPHLCDSGRYRMGSCLRVPVNIDYLGMLAGGLDRKRWLLQHEEPSAAEAGRLF